MICLKKIQGKDKCLEVLVFYCYDENGFFSKKNSIHTIGHTDFWNLSSYDRDKKTGIILLSNRIHPIEKIIKFLSGRKNYL